MEFKKIAFIFLFSGLSPALASETAAPLDVTKTFMNNLLNLSALSKSDKSADSPEAKQVINSLSTQIDLESLASRSIGSKWKKIPKDQREEFKTLLQQLLESVVYPKAKNIAVEADKINYELLKNKIPQVSVTIPYEKEKNGDLIKETVNIVFIYKQNSDKLAIIDALLEKEAISANVKRQYDRAIEKKTFKDLLASMKKRIEDAKKETEDEHKIEKDALKKPQKNSEVEKVKNEAQKQASQ